jgi:hypothetical protein
MVLISDNSQPAADCLHQLFLRDNLILKYNVYVLKT